MTAMTTLERRLAATTVAAWMEKLRVERNGQHLDTLRELEREIRDRGLTPALMRSTDVPKKSTVYAAYRTRYIPEDRLVMPEGSAPTAPGDYKLAWLSLAFLELRALSFWPYREGWLEAAARYGPEQHVLVEGYLRSLARWAASCPHLARTGPPPCVIEDLRILLPEHPKDQLDDIASFCVSRGTGRSASAVYNTVRVLLLGADRRPPPTTAKVAEALGDYQAALAAGQVDAVEARILLPHLTELREQILDAR